jgi:hypothetical protein
LVNEEFFRLSGLDPSNMDWDKKIYNVKQQIESDEASSVGSNEGDESDSEKLINFEELYNSIISSQSNKGIEVKILS